MHYLDNAATTPLRDEVLEAMLPYLKESFGNPASVYAAGRQAKKGLEEAREKVAAAIGSEPSEVIFTGGGTEADNLALKGAAEKLHGPAGGRQDRNNHIITSSIEHHAVLHSAEWLERRGHRITFLPVDASALVDLAALELSCSDETILVSVIAANNEVGTVQPVAEVARIARERSHALVHTDAVQGLGKISVNVKEFDVDLASFSAHKIGGPKGVGALYVRSGTHIAAFVHGGGQERDLRSGTSNVAGIVGFGEAARLAALEVDSETERLAKLRDRLEAGLLASIEGIRVNGGEGPRLSGTSNLSIEGVEGESLLLMLDAKDIAASSGSACTSGSLDPSHVLLAMGVSPEMAHGSLRFTLGRTSSDEDIDAVLSALPEIVERLRSIAPLDSPRQGSTAPTRTVSR